MSIYYFDAETSGTSRKDDKIITLQFQKLDGLLDGEIAPLVVLKEWEDPKGERGIFDRFTQATGFYNRKWDFVSAGFNLARFDFSWMWHKGLKYGHIPFTADPFDWMRPHIDLHHTVLLFNAKAKKPNGELGNVPAMFYGSKLSDFSAKRGGMDGIFKLYAQKRYSAIEAYIRQEAAAFIHLWRTLIEEMPGVWEGIIRPKLGLDEIKPRQF